MSKMPKYTYDDIVTVLESAPAVLRPGSKAWVVGVAEERQGSYFDSFPEGVVYTVEFEDGESVDIHEDNLRLWRE